jgi:hypothetical protein
MISFCDRLDESGQCFAHVHKSKKMLLDGIMVIDRHRQRLAPYQRNPLRIGFPRQGLDSKSVCFRRISSLQTVALFAALIAQKSGESKIPSVPSSRY